MQGVLYIMDAENLDFPGNDKTWNLENRAVWGRKSL